MRGKRDGIVSWVSRYKGKLPSVGGDATGPNKPLGSSLLRGGEGKGFPAATDFINCRSGVGLA